VARLACNS